MLITEKKYIHISKTEYADTYGKNIESLVVLIQSWISLLKEEIKTLV